MQRAKQDIERALLRKGFVQDERHHHYFIYVALDGLRTAVRTHTSHGSSKSIGQPLLGQMSRQCGLEVPQSLALVDCPLGRGEYEGLLRERGRIGG